MTHPLRSLPALLCALIALLLLAAASSQAAEPGVNIAGAPTPDRVTQALATKAKTIRVFAYWSEFEKNAAGDFPSGNAQAQDLSSTFLAAAQQMNRGGAKPVFVVLGSPPWANGGSQNPFLGPDPAKYASFLARFAEFFTRNGVQVAAYEVWNEPDGGEFWQPAPDPDGYTAVLKAAYAAARPKTTAAILVAGMNQPWMKELYDRGARGSFDGSVVHTDPACGVAAPGDYFRDEGRISRFTFLAYRELRAEMLARGDDDKTIWMTELGWSSTDGDATSCDRGVSAGKKPSGVSRAVQAQYLAEAYQCIANDPYVVNGMWFTMIDAGRSSKELENYGLLDAAGQRKPSYDAFAKVVAADGGAAGPCGDFDGPSITVLSPKPGTQFTDKLDLSASAVDGGVGVLRIAFAFNGGQTIQPFSPSGDGVAVGLKPWFGSSKLGLGAHTVEVTAIDRNGNTSKTTIPVTKVAEGAIPQTLTPKFKLRKVTCKKRNCTLKGTLSRNGIGRPTIGGRVVVSWEFKNRKGQWRRLRGGLAQASKAFTFKAALKPGLWRVKVAFPGSGPYKKASSSTIRLKRIK